MDKNKLMEDFDLFGITVTDGKVCKADYELYKQCKSCISTAADPSVMPPKKWWNKMHKKIKEGNPSYDEDQISSTIGDIWYNKLSDSKRSEIRKREGKTYAPAK